MNKIEINIYAGDDEMVKEDGTRRDSSMEIFINGEKLREDITRFRLDFIPPEAGKKYFQYNYKVDYALSSPYGYQENCEKKNLDH